MNFKEFQASKVEHANIDAIAALHGFETDDTRPALVYARDCYVMVNADNTYRLQLGRAEWVTANLQECEARLYLWCLTECPDAMGISDNTHAALCELLDLISEDDAVQSLLSGNWEPNA